MRACKLLFVWFGLGLGLAQAATSVVVLPFSNRSPNEGCSWISVALPDVFQHALRQHPAFVPIDHEALEAIEAELKLDCLKPHAIEDVVKAGSLLEANHVLYGQFTPEEVEERILVDIKLVEIDPDEPSKSKVVATHRFRVFTERMLEAVPTAVKTLAEQLGDKNGGKIEPGVVQPAFPTRSFSAFEAYHRAQEYLSVQEWEEALRLLLEARLADPDFLEPRLILATLYDQIDQRELGGLERLYLARHPKLTELEPQKLRQFAVAIGQMGQYKLHEKLMAAYCREALKPVVYRGVSTYAQYSSRFDMNEVMRYSGRFGPDIPGLVYINPDGTVPPGTPPVWRLHNFKSTINSNMIQWNHLESIYVAPPGLRIVAAGYEKGRICMSPSILYGDEERSLFFGMRPVGDNPLPGHDEVTVFQQPLTTCVLRYPVGEQPGKLAFLLEAEDSFAQVDIQSEPGADVLINNMWSPTDLPASYWLRPGSYTLQVRSRNPASGPFQKTPGNYAGTQMSEMTDEIHLDLTSGSRVQLNVDSPLGDAADQLATLLQNIEKHYADSDASHELVWEGLMKFQMGSMRTTLARQGNRSVAMWSGQPDRTSGPAEIKTWICELDPRPSVRLLEIPGTQVVFDPHLFALEDGTWRLLFWDLEAKNSLRFRSAISLDGLTWQVGPAVNLRPALARMMKDHRYGTFQGDGKYGLWNRSGEVFVASDEGGESLKLNLSDTETVAVPRQPSFGVLAPRPINARANLHALTWQDGAWLGLMSENEGASESRLKVVELSTTGRSPATVAQCVVPRLISQGNSGTTSLQADSALEFLDGLQFTDGFNILAMDRTDDGGNRVVNPIARGWELARTPGVFAHARTKIDFISGYRWWDSRSFKRRDGRMERVLFVRCNDGKTFVVRGVTDAL